MTSLFGTLLWLLASLGLYPTDRPQAAHLCADRATADSYEGASAQEVSDDGSRVVDWSPLTWFSSSEPGEPISNGF